MRCISEKHDRTILPCMGRTIFCYLDYNSEKFGLVMGVVVSLV